MNSFPPLHAAAVSWNRFFAPQPQHAMVISRIGLGTVIFLSSLLKLPDVPRLFGPEGIGGIAWAPIRSKVGYSAFHQFMRLPFESASMEVVWLLFAVMMIASLAFALGAFTRASGVVLLILHMMFFERGANSYAGSWASQYNVFLFCTLLAPTGRQLSIDAWRKRRGTGGVRSIGATASDWLGPAIPVRMLQMHICAVYAAAGWMRFGDPGWLRGEMVYAALTDDWWSRIDIDWFPFMPLLKLMTYFAFVLEPLAPFLLWVRGVGKWIALALMGMHITLELVTNLGLWQFQMVAVLTVFMPPKWLAPILRQTRERVSPACEGDLD
jgi:hypothetical protein